MKGEAMFSRFVDQLWSAFQGFPTPWSVLILMSQLDSIDCTLASGLNAQEQSFFKVPLYCSQPWQYRALTWRAFLEERLFGNIYYIIIFTIYLGLVFTSVVITVLSSDVCDVYGYIIHVKSLIPENARWLMRSKEFYTNFNYTV